jgi:hypothetical protein
MKNAFCRANIAKSGILPIFHNQYNTSYIYTLLEFGVLEEPKGITPEQLKALIAILKSRGNGESDRKILGKSVLSE